MAFGSPFRVPYASYLEGKTVLVDHRLGFFGVHWPGWSRLAEVLAAITVRPQRGLLYAAVDRGRRHELRSAPSCPSPPPPRASARPRRPTAAVALRPAPRGLGLLHAGVG